VIPTVADDWGIDVAAVGPEVDGAESESPPPRPQPAANDKTATATATAVVRAAVVRAAVTSLDPPRISSFFHA